LIVKDYLEELVAAGELQKQKDEERIRRRALGKTI
jgi:hypothetical protein